MIINEAQIAAALPAYELGEVLGRGAFGLVVKGRHRELDRPVAIKILPAGTDETAASSRAEARLLAALDHPHVVRVYDSIPAGDLHLIVMELLSGGTLTRRRAGIPPEAACAVGLAVAAALGSAHQRGVLHRDIKPDNILFDAAGLLKVTDFGIAKLVEGSATTASAIVGTPRYMAPEQLLARRLGPATDLYALGVMLYELLSGAPPFDPALPPTVLAQQHIYTVPAPPAGVPAPVAAVIMRALAKDPDGRQPSAHAFALELARAAAVYGPGWTARAGIALRLDDDLQAAVQQPASARPPFPSGQARPGVAPTANIGQPPAPPFLPPSPRGRGAEMPFPGYPPPLGGGAPRVPPPPPAAYGPPPAPYSAPAPYAAPPGSYPPVAPGGPGGSGPRGQQPGGGYPQPPGYGNPYGYGPQPPAPYGASVRSYYAGWGARVRGTLIDLLIVWGVSAVPAAAAPSSSADGISGLIFFASIIIMCCLEGVTGQTPGRRIARIRLVRELDGRPLGLGRAFVRRLCHFLDALPFYVGFLWPLWDAKRQTFADKIMKSVVIRTR
ncbi:serine/threonine protein kinase [Candidatus Protofrankia datiscae]|uniref:non-specific serine/threonine protein kinase n=1 Tax=Candidatus Protofrankia datiscae TaxID=2716812 RepID=F8B1I0_9ACTN|nr:MULTISPECIES: protein kinase [Protofrankia]AEH10732.1 serine/threonine protein kinase [Candidatus Protofrankia datiscae]